MKLKQVIRRLPPIDNRVALLLAAFASVLLNVHIQRHAVINLDGILYLRTAKAFLTGGLDHAIEHYQWIFYPVLIAKISVLTHCSLQSAAQLLNQGLWILTTCSWLLCTLKLSDKPRIPWVGLAMILCFSKLNGYRGDILRDIGYWGCLLGCFGACLSFNETGRTRHAIAMVITASLALLFRIEGLALVLITPMAPWLSSQPLGQRFRRCCVVLGIWLLLGIAMVAILLQTGTQIDFEPLLLQRESGIVSDWLRLLQAQEFSPLVNLSSAIQTHLPSYSRNFSMAFALGGLTTLLLIKFVHTLTLNYLALACFTLKEQRVVQLNHMKLWCLFVCLCAVLPTAFMAQKLFVSSRYLIPLTLIVLLPVPTILQGCFERWLQERTLLSCAAAVLCLLLLLLGLKSSLEQHSSKHHLLRSVEWLEQQLSHDQRLLTNSPRVAYALEERNVPALVTLIPRAETLTVASSAIEQSYDLVVFRFNRYEHTLFEQTQASMAHEPDHVFNNPEGDQVAIYHLQPVTSHD